MPLQQPHIARLPTELIELIFLTCLSSDLYHGVHLDPGQATLPIVLSHVCRQWREITDDLAGLWTTVDFSSLDMAMHHLQRSRELRLKVLWRANFSPDIITRICNEHAHRFKTLVVHGDPFELKLLLSVASPHLQVLHDLVILPSRGFAPISGFVLFEERIIMPGLQSMYLRSIEVALEDLLDLFRNSSSLKSIILHGIRVIPGRSMQDKLAPVSLPNLTSLMCKDMDISIRVDLLEHIHFPLECAVSFVESYEASQRRWNDMLYYSGLLSMKPSFTHIVFDPRHLDFIQRDDEGWNRIHFQTPCTSTTLTTQCFIQVGYSPYSFSRVHTLDISNEANIRLRNRWDTYYDSFPALKTLIFRGCSQFDVLGPSFAFPELYEICIVDTDLDSDTAVTHPGMAVPVFIELKRQIQERNLRSSSALVKQITLHNSCCREENRVALAATVETLVVCNKNVPSPECPECTGIVVPDLFDARLEYDILD